MSDLDDLQRRPQLRAGGWRRSHAGGAPTRQWWRSRERLMAAATGERAPLCGAPLCGSVSWPVVVASGLAVGLSRGRGQPFEPAQQIGCIAAAAASTSGSAHRGVSWSSKNIALHCLTCQMVQAGRSRSSTTEASE